MISGGEDRHVALILDVVLSFIPRSLYPHEDEVLEKDAPRLGVDLAADAEEGEIELVAGVAICGLLAEDGGVEELAVDGIAELPGQVKEAEWHGKRWRRGGGGEEKVDQLLDLWADRTWAGPDKNEQK